MRQVPFSRRGSYFVVSRFEKYRNGAPEGLYLRTIHGDARNKELFSLELTADGKSVPFTEKASAEKLVLRTDEGSVELCITDRHVLIRGEKIGLRMTAGVGATFDLIVPQGKDRWQYVGCGANLSLMITRVDGEFAVDAPWNGSKNEKIILSAGPTSGGSRFAFVLEEFYSSFSGAGESLDFDSCVRDAHEDFAQWLGSVPSVPQKYTKASELAAYVNWSSVVDKRGLMRRPSMLMSKNWMTNIWSWDHCFNAMALTANIGQACDQILTMFDHQDEYGALPDFFNDAQMTFNFCKPPIHGWTLAWLMGKTDLPEPFLRKVYEPLCRWTKWWLTFRDYDGDGFPQYNHGNDSGWDNSTVFRKYVPVESPDLLAFLVLQTETIARLAERFGRYGEQKMWQEKSENLLAGLIRDFWKSDHFAARHAVTHECIECDSLLPYIPLVLGHRLPKKIFGTLADALVGRGFLTEYGLATELPKSLYYEPDGYWRGPIWAPSTLLIADGLVDGGRKDLAVEIARRFCNMAAKNGMAENYDALTGKGLRDRAYTWTSSVFLILAGYYLG